jgi:hypothetical protein
MLKLRRHLNPPTVLAALALFVALGGSSFAAPARDAAAKLISGKSIKNNSIASADIKNNSVGSGDVKNRSLLKKDFKTGQLPAGPAGPRGPQGVVGPAGLGKLRYVTHTQTFAPGSGGQVRADCPTGFYPTGGGAFSYLDTGSDLPNTVAVEDLLQTDLSGRPNGWATFAANPGTVPADPDLIVEVDAVCAPGTTPDPVPGRIP